MSLRACFLFLFALSALRAAAQEEAETLTRVSDAVAMTSAQARERKTPVRFTGTLTFREPRRGWFFLQDEGAGILVIPGADLARPAPGSKVTVTGTLNGGVYAPFVSATGLTDHGPGAWPVPARATVHAVWKNEHFAHWVEIEGRIADAVAASPGVIILAINTTEGTAYTAMHDAPPDLVRPDWKDAMIRVRGVNWVEGSTFLHLSGPAHAEILKTGMANVFDAPQTTAAQLLSGPLPAGRVKLRAMMTAAAYGEAAAFLCEGTGLIAHGTRGLTSGTRLVAAPQSPVLQPGDDLEMAGFASVDAGHLVMRNTEVRVLKSGTPPAPVATSLAEVAAGKLNSRLVTVSGRLVSVQTIAEGNTARAVLTLEDGGQLTPAMLHLPEAQPLIHFPPDYITEITGVVFPAADGKGPHRILLRNAKDAKSKHLAFTAVTQRALQIGGIALAGGMGLLGWILALRRRVKKQSAEQRQTEEELRKALAAERDLSRLKSNFVSMVSHEFRTPLGIISVSSELLSRYRDRLKPDQLEEHLGAITNATKRMAGMMENILVLSRVDTNRLECTPAPLDLPGLCRRLVDEMHSITSGACPIHFTAGPGTDAPARADESILRHILPNLLSNACKYSPDGGMVNFTLSREGKDAVFTITDRGIGISEDDQEKLFQSFHRGANVGQTPGTGLGLVIVKRCVDLHGGSVSVTRTPGQGSTFTVKLPLFP